MITHDPCANVIRKARLIERGPHFGKELFGTLPVHGGKDFGRLQTLPVHGGTVSMHSRAVDLSIYRSIHRSISLTESLYIHLSIYLSIYLPYLSIYLTIYRSIQLSNRPIYLAMTLQSQALHSP